jgi:hypothetical protein
MFPISVYLRQVIAFILISGYILSNSLFVTTFAHQEIEDSKIQNIQNSSDQKIKTSALNSDFKAKAPLEIAPFRDDDETVSTPTSYIDTSNTSPKVEATYKNLSSTNKYTSKQNYNLLDLPSRFLFAKKLPITPIFYTNEPIPVQFPSIIDQTDTVTTPSTIETPPISPPPAITPPLILQPVIPSNPILEINTPKELTSLQKQGKWSDPQTMSVVGIQASTLPNGKVMLYDGSEGVGTGDARTLNYQTYDTLAKSFTKSTAVTPLGDLLKYSAFCAAMLILPSGNLFIAGGDVQGDAVGTKKSGIFDSVNNTWSLLKQMAFPRWYPTAIQTLNDKILVVGGTQDSYTNPATTPELYDFTTNTWNSLTGADDTNDGAYGGSGHFYPWLYNLNNSNVANLGPRPTISIINTESEGAINNFAPRDLYDNDKILSSRMQTYGSVARFSANEILFTGGGNDELEVNKSKLGQDSTDLFGTKPVETANIIKLDELLKTPPSKNGADPTFTQQTGNPKIPRSNATLVIMADGKVMLTGGTSMNEGANRNAQYDNAVLTSEIWDKTTGKWTDLSDYKTHRIYHSIALLQKDATVIQAGGSGFGGQCTQQRGANNITVKGANACKQFEIYNPGYLFDIDGNLKNRPTITSNQPINLVKGTNFNISSDKDISKVTFVKAGNVTHSTNTQQYFMDTIVNINGRDANITLPNTYFAAPKGIYFMFVWDKDGTPSVAQEINVN